MVVFPYMAVLILYPVCLAIAPIVIVARWIGKRVLVGMSLGIMVSPCFADALEELNAQRANAGLAPIVADPELMRFAQAKAEWQAARHVSGFVPISRDDYAIRRDPRGRAYNGHEGPRLPGGFEGTGCGRNPGPFVACRWDSVGTNIRGGAGVAIGSDGFRYMVVMTDRDYADSTHSAPLIRTSHLTPNAPRIPFLGSIPADPSGWHVPTKYDFGTKPVICKRCGLLH